jgi:hypothetical protein
MRLASNSLAKAFPAKTMGQARAAVIYDLENLFVEIGGPFLSATDSPIMAKNARDSLTVAVRTNRGALLGVDTLDDNRNSDMGKMAELHQRQRSKATGRVSSAGRLTRDVGRWKFINRQIVGPGAIAKYAKAKVFPKLGMLKAGWLLPSNAPATNKVASWITKARANLGTMASYVDKMDATANGFLQLTNLVRHSPKHQGLVRIEIQKRQRDLLNFAGKRLQKKIDQFNRGAA